MVDDVVARRVVAAMCPGKPKVGRSCTAQRGRARSRGDETGEGSPRAALLAY